ncbi:MAG: ABC transporter permease, partial [Thermoplasmata archaeon]|nr:ABC transporter permease [Thermoplasmata archaeon]
IGTAIISGSLVVGDTLENLFTKSVYDTYDETDETIFTYTPNATYAYFNFSMYRGIEAFAEGDPVLSRLVEGMSPEIVVGASAFDPRTRLSEAGLQLWGFDAAESRAFGGFTSTSGRNVAGDDLGSDEVLVNELVADEMDIRAGDRLIIYYGTNLSGAFVVRDVVEVEGRAAFGMAMGVGGMNIFMDLRHLQALLGVGDTINYIKVSNVGDKQDGMAHSDAVAGRLQPYLSSNVTPPLIISTAKADAIDFALDGSESLEQLFLVLGSFSIIAGVLLVVNIFVMLAEERKGEMGISRAIGLRRTNLMYMFLFEGAVLAAFASLIGVFAGLAVAYLIILGFSNIFIGSSFPIMEYFTYRTDSIVLAFSGGLLITFITIVYASWKVSKLNIIRAIRNIPEPRYQRHEATALLDTMGPVRRALTRLKDTALRHYELIVIAIGAAMFIGAVQGSGAIDHQAWAVYGGASLVVMGAGFLLRRYMLDERAFTITGLVLLVIWGYPYDLFNAMGIETTEGFEMWVLAGLFLVGGALMVIISNNELILNGLIRIFGRFRSVVPVFKTAISYPMASKFRTGMTLAMFSLIIFTITTTAMIIGQIEGNIDQIQDEQSGGFHMIGYTNPNTPIRDIEAEMRANANTSAIFDRFDAIVPLRSAYVNMRPIGKVEGDYRDRAVSRNVSMPFPAFAENGTWYNVIGCSALFIEESSYDLDDWDRRFGERQEDVWQNVRTNGTIAIVDATIVPDEYGPPGVGLDIGIGTVVVVRDPFGRAHNLTVVGIMKQTLIQGIFVNESVVTATFRTDTSFLTLFRFADGMSERQQDRTAKVVEAEFVANGMQTFIIRKELESMLKMIKDFFYLLEAFIGLGLIVGIAGLGIITIRSVTERRQQIGMLRAIGFRRGMVLKSFLIESSFIALLGIAVGVGLGIVIGFRLFLEFETAVFVVPWDTILAVSGVSYMFTFITTVGPSRSAARVAPAEALRYMG